MNTQVQFPIRVGIVEDSDRIRESLRMLIDGSPGFNCCGAYGSAEEALQELPRRKPDVVLMDINLPGKTGIECVREMKVKFPDLQMVMLTVYEDADQVFESLLAGACGYLLKRTNPAKLMEAIEEVHRGGSPMTSHIARKVIQTFHQRGARRADTAALTGREEEVLAALAQGLSYREIAESLKIGVETVRTHIRSLYDKMQVHSRTEAVVKYLNR